MTVGGLKFLFSRSRPIDEEGVRDFDMLGSTHTSFPSEHTSTAFAMVTPWVMYYDHPLTYSLYIISVGVGIARIAKCKHWLSDVAAGALIGTYWGYYLSKNHQSNKETHLNSDKRNKVDISPFYLGSGGGVVINLQF